MATKQRYEKIGNGKINVRIIHQPGRDWTQATKTDHAYVAYGGGRGRQARIIKKGTIDECREAARVWLASQA